jgi:hypothetical protein
VRRRAHQITASGHSGGPKLTCGDATGREEHGEVGSGLTGARAAAWRPGDGGTEPEAAAPGEREARAWREAKRGWERCGELRGLCSPFIGVGEHQGGVARGLTPVLMALMPLKTREGLREELREGK